MTNRVLKDRLECPICGYLAKVLSETETEIEGYCANCGMDIVVNKMTENKRYFVEKHFLKKNKVRDTICSISRNIDETVEHMNILYNKYVSLKNENEQLKSVVKEVIELLSEEVDVFSDKATEHDINAYIELKELDNKDAYYMATATKKAIKLLKRVADE